jgi:hypothetical protein
MSEPIVFISRHRIRHGRADELQAALEAGGRSIRSTKPATVLFAPYFDLSREEVRIVHVFADSRAMTLHFEGAAERTATVADLIEPLSFEVYGPAPAEAVEQLRLLAAESGAGLLAFPDAIGGFLRV